jgi:uncharacterized protein YbbC (DUF1343 family)
MLYAMQAAARNHLTVVVADRPNPLTGVSFEGPTLDTTLAYAQPGTPEHPARPYALYPIPLRHGLTMGELARLYNDVLGIHADLRVIPVRGWQRALWGDQTGLPWIQPSPNLPHFRSAVLYPALVAFEGSNLSVGRGTDAPFEQFGAPWMDGRKLAKMLNEREIEGLHFIPVSFTPSQPSDGKYAGRSVNGVRMMIIDRRGLHAGRICGTILWALAKTYPDSLHIDSTAFDLRFGSARARRALMQGKDPDAVADAWLPGAVAFQQRSLRYMLYQ